MATEVDWSSVGGTSGTGSKAKFIKFSAGKSVKVRPVGRAVEFCKFFVKTANGNRSVCVDLENSEKAASILADHTGQDVEPQHRFAINVIDRSDGEVKILEGGKSIFNAFAGWAKEMNCHPGGTGGGDWAIAATGDGKMRRYQCNHLKTTVISAEEKAKVKAAVDERSLEEVFKGIPLNELIEKTFGGQAGEPEPGNPAQTSDAEVDDAIGW